MPRSKAKEKAFKKIFVASDFHSLFLDKRAFEVFLACLSENEADEIILNGDVMDIPMLMRADKQKIIRTAPSFSFLEEVEFTIHEILEPIRKAHKKTPIVYKVGNHEDRAIRILRGNAPGLEQLVEAGIRKDRMRFESLLELDRLGIELSMGENGTGVDFRRMRGTRAAILHGARTSANRLKQNLAYYLCSGTSGHTHKMSSAEFPYYGGTFRWVESGCLRTIHNIEYMPHGADPGWQHGFVTIWQHRDTGQTFVKGHEISNYKLEFHGQTYEA